MKTTKEQRYDLRSYAPYYLDPFSGDLLRGILDDLEAAEAEVQRLRKFITYWSYCTYTGMLRSCPEKQNELREALASFEVEPYRQESESGK